MGLILQVLLSPQRSLTPSEVLVHSASNQADGDSLCKLIHRAAHGRGAVHRQALFLSSSILWACICMRGMPEDGLL